MLTGSQVSGNSRAHCAAVAKVVSVNNTSATAPGPVPRPAPKPAAPDAVSKPLSESDPVEFVRTRLPEIAELPLPEKPAAYTKVYDTLLADLRSLDT